MASDFIVCIATALVMCGSENDAGDAISGDVWTEAHDRGLIETVRDMSGDGWTRATEAGERFLADAIAASASATGEGEA